MFRYKFDIHQPVSTILGKMFYHVRPTVRYMLLFVILLILASTQKQLHLDLVSRDPDFVVTPLVKFLLCKRRKLRRQGKDVEADALAAKINRLICDYRKTRLSHLSSEAGPKELWEAVRATSTKSVVNGNLSDPNLVNNHFATYIISKMCSSTMQYQ